MSFFNELNTAIDGRLTAGTALIAELGGTAIYHGYAPEGCALPYVVWSYQASNRDNWTPRDSSQTIVFIRAYAKTAKVAGKIDDKVDALMKATLSVGTWNNFWLAREEELYLPETDEAGKTIWMCGAYYRIRLDK